MNALIGVQEWKVGYNKGALLEIQYIATMLERETTDKDYIEKFVKERVKQLIGNLKEAEEELKEMKK